MLTSCLLGGDPLTKVHLPLIAGYIKCSKEIFAHLSQVHAKVVEETRWRALALGDQSEQHVRRARLRVAEVGLAETLSLNFREPADQVRSRRVDPAH